MKADVPPSEQLPDTEAFPTHISNQRPASMRSHALSCRHARHTRGHRRGLCDATDSPCRAECGPDEKMVRPTEPAGPGKVPFWELFGSQDLRNRYRTDLLDKSVSKAGLVATVATVRRSGSDAGTVVRPCLAGAPRPSWDTTGRTRPSPIVIWAGSRWTKGACDGVCVEGMSAAARPVTKHDDVGTCLVGSIDRTSKSSAQGPKAPPLKGLQLRYPKPRP